MGHVYCMSRCLWLCWCQKRICLLISLLFSTANKRKLENDTFLLRSLKVYTQTQRTSSKAANNKIGRKSAKKFFLALLVAGWLTLGVKLRILPGVLHFAYVDQMEMNFFFRFVSFSFFRYKTTKKRGKKGFLYQIFSFSFSLAGVLI